MTATLIFTTTVTEREQFAASRGAIEALHASVAIDLLKEGKTVTVPMNLCAGWRAPDNCGIEFSDSFPTDGPERSQAQARSRRLVPPPQKPMAYCSKCSYGIDRNGRCRCGHVPLGEAMAMAMAHEPKAVDRAYPAKVVAAHEALAAREGHAMAFQLAEAQAHIRNLENTILDVERRLRRQGNPKWIPLHIEEAVYDIAARENAGRSA